jgi:hypothetical protein
MIWVAWRQPDDRVRRSLQAKAEAAGEDGRRWQRRSARSMLGGSKVDPPVYAKATPG